jgi:Gpi18-like mannosyltransferase
VAIHVGLIVAGFVLVMVFNPGSFTGPGDPFDIWAHWDAPHFFEIARYGYGPPADPARIVLFPFFPGLIALGSLVVTPLAAGMVVSFVATLFAAAGVYRLARQDYGRRTARASVIALNLFPTAFVFVAPYSEAPFLAFVVWSLIRAREDDWRLAGIFALLASVTRLQGAFLIPALGLEYLVRHRRFGRDLGWIVVAAIGPLIYLGINLVTFGNPLKFVEIQQSVFHVQNINPIDSLRGLLTNVAAPHWNENWLTVYVAPLITEILLLVVVVWACRAIRRRPADATYALLTLVSLATLSWPISLPRYILGIPGLFIFVGRGIARPNVGPLVVAMLTVLLTACMTLFLINHWAF